MNKSFRLVKISKRVKVFHFDLTTRCMLKCAFCAKASSSLKSNLDFDISLLDKLPLEETDSILLCGRTGEPSLYPQLFEFIEMCQKRAPKSRIDISTNGMLNDKSWWRELAKILKDRDHSLIFCIDGLKDTLPIYRKGSNFDQIIENASEFISSGGSAIWKFIVFKHNEHQMKQTEKLSDELKFKQFIPILSYYYDKTFEKPSRYLNVETKRESSKSNRSYVHCRMEELGEFFITHSGYVIPCCLISPLTEDEFFLNIEKLNLSQMDFKMMRNSDYFNKFKARISFFNVCDALCRTSIDTWANPRLNED